MSLERAVRAKIAGKRDPQMEKEAKEWVEAVLGEKFPSGMPYEECFRDGTSLCKLMNKLVPDCIPKINTSGGQFKMMENITFFLNAIKAYGVPDVDWFQTADLWEKKDIGQVTTTLFALGRTSYMHSDFKGPWLGPKPSEENKREFTEAQMRAGEGIMGLQAGTKQDAMGVSFGAGRKIILGK